MKRKTKAEGAAEAKSKWLAEACRLIQTNGYNAYDQGIWCNLHMLQSQGMTVEAAVAKLPELLPRLTKHTPGPWSASFHQGEAITAAIQPGRRQDEWRIDPPAGDTSNGVAIVASVHGPNMARNAHLIAAAPDLLEALQSALHLTDGTPLTAAQREGVTDEILAAITKATKG